MSVLAELLRAFLHIHAQVSVHYLCSVQCNYTHGEMQFWAMYEHTNVHPLRIEEDAEKKVIRFLCRKKVPPIVKFYVDET